LLNVFRVLGFTDLEETDLKAAMRGEDKFSYRCCILWVARTAVSKQSDADGQVR
jgi:hypothetical protein